MKKKIVIGVCSDVIGSFHETVTVKECSITEIFQGLQCIVARSAGYSHKQARAQSSNKRFSSGNYVKFRAGHIRLYKIEILHLVLFPQGVERKHIDCFDASFFTTAVKVCGVKSCEPVPVWNNHLLAASLRSNSSPINLNICESALAHNSFQDLEVRSDGLNGIHFTGGSSEL